MTAFVPARRPSNFPALWSHDVDFQANATGYANVLTLQAAATLLIGDAVYLNSAGKVAKTAVGADYLRFMGIVVGGASWGEGLECSFDPTLVGVTAAILNQYVYVASYGSIVYATAGAAIVAGSAVGISATAGRVDDTASGNMFGYALEAGVNATGVKILLMPGIRVV